MRKYLLSLTGALAGLAFAGSALAQPLNFATLQPGAINHVRAQVIGKVVNENSDLRVNVTPLGGSAQGIIAVSTESADFTISDASQVTDGVLGIAPFEAKNPNVRVAFTFAQLFVGMMVRNDSDIKTYADMAGKKFGSGFPGFPNLIPLSNGALAPAGLSLDDTVGVPVSSLIPAANDFQEGKTDAALFAIGAPKVAEVNAALESNGGVRFLSMDNSPESLARVKAIKIDYNIVTLNPNPRFAGILGPTNVVAVPLIIAVGPHVSDDDVYAFVKAVSENKPQLAAGHPSFNSFFPERMALQYQELEYHPGAIKFFKEQGIWPGS